MKHELRRAESCDHTQQVEGKGGQLEMTESGQM